ncbi:MAG: hypothetical protein HC801_13665 [Nitrospira sp.]|nr:hypothetical protein [Nitrospira sp.]
MVQQIFTGVGGAGDDHDGLDHDSLLPHNIETQVEFEIMVRHERTGGGELKLVIPFLEAGKDRQRTQGQENRVRFSVPVLMRPTLSGPANSD